MGQITQAGKNIIKTRSLVITFGLKDLSVLGVCPMVLCPERLRDREYALLGDICRPARWRSDMSSTIRLYSHFKLFNLIL